MIRIDIEKYLNELGDFGTEEKEPDLYSLKKEIINLNKSSKIFENFEKESMIIDKNVLSQIQDFSLLMKIKNLASEIKNKNKINEKLHSLHFNLNLLKNSTDKKTVSSVINLFLYNHETKIDTIIGELNDFKKKLDEIKKHHSNLLPKSLDNKLEIENKYSKHIEQLHSIHKKQKSALISTAKLFLKLTKKQIKNLKRFKNNSIKH